MKIVFISIAGILAMLVSDAWCQPQQPSGPGETLRHSQDTMEYYRLQRELQKSKKQINDNTDSTKEKSGNQKEIEIDDDYVIQYFDESKPESEK